MNHKSGKTPTIAPSPATEIPLEKKQTSYPSPFTGVVAGREKRKLGDYFGLENFGINLTRLAPGAASALAHHHARQDEFIYVLEGHPTLIMDNKPYTLNPGDCCGFKAGTQIAAQIINRSQTTATILEIGDRTPRDVVEYPDDDLRAVQQPDGQWQFLHKDGEPY